MSLPAPLPVPAEPDDLTPPWLSRTLGQPVADVAITPLDGAGVSGRLYQVAVAYARPTRLAGRFVVKLAAADPVIRERQSAGAYAAEVAAYRQLRRYALDPPFAVEARDPGYWHTRAAGVLAAPRMWHAAHDPARGNYVVLLDDLTDGRTGDDEAGLTDAEALAVARALGELHAAGPMLLAGRPEPWPIAWPGMLARFARVLAARGGDILARYRDDMSADVAALVPELPARLAALPARLPHLPDVLAHGDIQPRNLIFHGPAGAPAVALVDWGSALVAPGVLDLCNVLSITIAPDRQAALAGPVLAAYRETAGAGCPPMGELLAAHRAVLDYRLARTFMFGGGAAPGSWVEALTRRNLAWISAAYAMAGPLRPPS